MSAGIGCTAGPITKLFALGGEYYKNWLGNDIYNIYTTCYKPLHTAILLALNENQIFSDIAIPDCSRNQKGI
jgi:hypothetical protein